MYTIYGATNTGMVREHNEDCFGGAMFAPCYGYAVVCDGMGGENGGSIASRLACDEIARVLDGSYRDDLDEKAVYLLIETALENANTAVYNRAQQSPELTGMGTTVILAVLLGDTCYLAHVGDSRAYLLQNDSLEQLTVDHTLVQAMVDRGEITPEQASVHPQRHYLTRAIGIEPAVKPAFLQVALSEGDLVLLCSDGLYGTVGILDNNDIARILRHRPVELCCELFIDEANALGGFDNITAMVIETCGGAVNG